MFCKAGFFFQGSQWLVKSLIRIDFGITNKQKSQHWYSLLLPMINFSTEYSVSHSSLKEIKKLFRKSCDCRIIRITESSTTVSPQVSVVSLDDLLRFRFRFRLWKSFASVSGSGSKSVTKSRPYLKNFKLYIVQNLVFLMLEAALFPGMPSSHL
jgi:hypothetical protein